MGDTSSGRESKFENVTDEGPILLSTTEVRGEFVMSQLRTKLCELVENRSIENEEETQVLVISGSHGNPDMGDSGLTNLEKLKDCKDKKDGDRTFGFYRSDCKDVGVKPDTFRPPFSSLPIPEDDIPDITTPMRKMNLEIFQDTFLSDELLCRITFKVINILHYHGNEEKLVADIKKLNPKVLAITWCFSLNGDMAMALRREGIFACMVMEHDLKLITGNPRAKLDEDQNSLIESIVEFEKGSGPRNIFISGYSGTGKTLFITEALKIKLNKMRKMIKEGKKANIIITTFRKPMSEIDEDNSLTKDLKEKYLKNLVNENFSKSGEERFTRFINFKQLCHELIGDECISEGERLRNTKLTDPVTGKMTMTFKELQEYFKKDRAAREASRHKGYIQAAMEDNAFDALFEKNVKGTLNQIISSLSSKSNCYNILLIDEVPSGVEHDWSDLVVADNVDWIMAVSPGGYTNCGNDFYDIKPPSNTNTTLTKKLLRRYRNCKEIRAFHNFWLEHGKFGHMSLAE